MKKFTVKDFITYNSPCFSCDNKINFYIGSKRVIDINDQMSLTHPFTYRPIVSSEYIELDVRINYSNTLKLQIFHKTNKIASNNIKDLIEYLQNHKLSLQSKCDRCHTTIESFDLSFNLEKFFIYPVSIKNERILVSTDESFFHIYSDYVNNLTTITIDKFNISPPNLTTTLKLPLIPLYKFKNKIQFLDKMKLYLTFS